MRDFDVIDYIFDFLIVVIVIGLLVVPALVNFDNRITSLELLNNKTVCLDCGTIIEKK